MPRINGWQIYDKRLTVYTLLVNSAECLHGRTGGEAAALPGALEHDNDDTSSVLSWSQDPIAEAAWPKPLGALHHPSNFCHYIPHGFW